MTKQHKVKTHKASDFNPQAPRCNTYGKNLGPVTLRNEDVTCGLCRRILQKEMAHAQTRPDDTHATAVPLG